MCRAPPACAPVFSQVWLALSGASVWTVHIHTCGRAQTTLHCGFQNCRDAFFCARGAHVLVPLFAKLDIRLHVVQHLGVNAQLRDEIVHVSARAIVRRFAQADSVVARALALGPAGVQESKKKKKQTKTP